MTTHRDSDDSVFQATIDALSHSSITTKLTKIQELNTELGVESTAIETQRGRLHKHKQKIATYKLDLETIQKGEEYTVSAGGGAAIPEARTVYVNKDYTGSTKDGKMATPYDDLEACIDVEIVAGKTDPVIIDISAHTYTVSRTVVQTATQHVTFRGKGIAKTIIQGGSSFGVAMNTNILQLEDFGDLTLTGITFRNCRYALLPKRPNRFTCTDCLFIRCGSSGDADNHDNSLSLSNQNDRYTNGSLQKLSNGGALRMESANGLVRIQNCQVKHCLRGLRPGDCLKGGIISNNYISDISESGIYLSKVSVGSDHVTVQNNTIVNANNNGILCIEAQNCVIKANTITDCWNSAIMLWSSADMTVENNTCNNNGYSNHNGIGNLGDNWSSGITCDGNSNMPANAKFQARIIGNTFINLHDGRAGEKIAIRLRNDNYANGNVNYVQNNHSSGADRHFKVDEGGSMPAVANVVSRRTTNQIEIFSPTANAEGFQMQDDTELVLCVHSNLSGCWVKLPLAPYDGQVVRVKNLQTSTSPSSSGFMYVQPSGSVVTTIDKRFYQIKLTPSMSTGDLEEGSNKCVTFIYVAAESTWVNCSDAY
jgi:parallel beta-helix repeat protein